MLKNGNLIINPSLQNVTSRPAKRFLNIDDHSIENKNGHPKDSR